MAKLVSLWFFVKENERKFLLSYLLRRSVLLLHTHETVISLHESWRFREQLLTVFDTVSFGLINLTVVGNGSHQFCRLRSEVWCPVLNSNVDCSVYSGRDYAQDEIILKLVLLVSLRTSFPCPNFHGLTLWIRTTYHGRVWSGDFF